MINFKYFKSAIKTNGRGGGRKTTSCRNNGRVLMTKNKKMKDKLKKKKQKFIL